MEIMELNQQQRAYLGPICKWRIIDLQSLEGMYDFKPNYSTLCRLMRRLEKSGVLASYRRPGENLKYLYLTAHGEKLIGDHEQPTAINQQTLVHDLRVSLFARRLEELGLIRSSMLEHEIHNKREFGSMGRVVPDARLCGRRLGKDFTMALEVELTVKSYPRVAEKVRQYLENSPYDYVMYVFERANHLKSYQAMLTEKLNDVDLRRLMFFCWDWASDVREAKGIFKEKETTLKEFFA